MSLTTRATTARLARSAVALACLVVVPVNAPRAFAQAQRPLPDSVAVRRDPVLEARTREVASQLRCVVCQGLSIADSPSELATEMKSVVREQLAAGKTPDEVKRYFVDKYGEWILLQPKASGFNLVVYLVPVIAVVGGIVFVVLAVRRWTSGAENTA